MLILYTRTQGRENPANMIRFFSLNINCTICFSLTSLSRLWTGILWIQTCSSVASSYLWSISELRMKPLMVSSWVVMATMLSYLLYLFLSITVHFFCLPRQFCLKFVVYHSRSAWFLLLKYCVTLKYTEDIK